MKKKTIANLIMVLTIALIVAVGVLVAWFLTEPEESLFGSEFHRTEIAGNRLVQNENTENLCTITIRCDTIFDNVIPWKKRSFLMCRRTARSCQRSPWSSLPVKQCLMF